MAVTDMETVPRYIADMGERLARLEQVAENTRRSLDRLETSVAGLRTEVTSQIGGLRTEFGGLRSEFGGFRAEVGGFRAEVAAKFRDVRTSVRTSSSGCSGSC